MAKNDNNNEIRCSFCGKPQSLVQKIIAGPGVYICDECISVSSELYIFHRCQIIDQIIILKHQ